jgi:light-regulated signal transduction histidine kinase (bacteriophytochrome)
MPQSEDIAKQTSHLTDCDRQAIHLPGSIQPHGVLLSFDRQFKIRQVSNNTQIYLNKEPQELLGKPLRVLFKKKQLEAIQQSISEIEDSSAHLKLSLANSDGDRHFDGIIYLDKEAIVLELEPTDSLTEMSFLSFHASVKKMSAKIEKIANPSEFLQLVASKIRQTIAFDRVMVYKFDSTGAGCVIAEDKREDLISYLGLHYPATDIPEASRELYTRTLLRYIPDLRVRSVELIPQENPITHQPLDLSDSMLRSFDPCCQEFHQNMGVTALLVISLIQDDRLWGLISCHHQAPKYLSYELRTVCEFLGQLVSRELDSKISHEEFDYKVKLQSLQSEFIESISQATNFIEALIEPAIRLLGLVSASGAAVCLDNEIRLVGKTPSTEEISTLIEWADVKVKDSLFCTDSLPKLYPAAQAFKDTASGLLLLRISKLKRYYILWFRPEVIQTVTWAGNPQDSYQVESDGSLTLCPRNSFEKWQEIVRFTSLPWQRCEFDSAIALRNAIVGIVLSKADELAKINLELERSNRELASFAYAASHDMKEPLRGIYNYSVILLEDYTQIIDEEGIEYLQTLVSLSQRMDTLIDVLLKFSQIGQTELNLEVTDLNKLVDRAIELFRASRLDTHQFDIRIPRPLPNIQCDRVLVNEVFSNLIGNAFKYNDRPHKWIEIGYLDATERSSTNPLFYIKDNGIGIQTHYLETIFRLFKRLHPQEKYGGGAGAGLAIVKKIIERHGGKIWVESLQGEGSTFFFQF